MDTTGATDRRAALQTMRLMTQTDIAAILGVTRQRAQRITRQDEFPAPAGEVGTTPVWFGDEVEAWHAGWDRRPGRRPHPTAHGLQAPGRLRSPTACTAGGWTADSRRSPAQAVPPVRRKSALAAGAAAARAHDGVDIVVR